MLDRSPTLSIADWMHEQTAVCPFGHTTHLRVFIDPDVLQYDEVWPAVGTRHECSRSNRSRS